MNLNRRIYVSMPADEWLNDNQNRLKWAIVKELEKKNYIPEIFSNPRLMPGKASNTSWQADKAYDIARSCIGGVIIGLPRWEFKNGDNIIKLTSEFCHYEGALFHSLKLPTLIVAQNDVLERTVFNYNFGPNIGKFTSTDDEKWLNTDSFKVPYNYWIKSLNERRDVFLGYCSKASKTAAAIKKYLKDALNLTVLDWRKFKPGEFILNEIGKAADRCSLGIFLFTKDDFLIKKTSAAKATPRDNVIFEAGYFISAKGKGRVLIIREKGAKLPADLGGDIYGDLQETTDIDLIKKTVSSFISQI